MLSLVLVQARDVGELRDWKSSVSRKLDHLVRENAAMRQGPMPCHAMIRDEVKRSGRDCFDVDVRAGGMWRR